MAKPIFIVGFPVEASPQSIQHVYIDLDNKLGQEYHVLTYRTSKIEDVSFQVLNVTDATDAQISELVEKTQNDIKRLLDELSLLEVNQMITDIKNNEEQNA
jgi:hypothetical protein